MLSPSFYFTSRLLQWLLYEICEVPVWLRPVWRLYLAALCCHWHFHNSSLIYTRSIKAQGRFTAVCLRGRGWGPRWGSGGQYCRQLMLDGDVSVSQSVCGTIRDKVLDGSTAKTYETIFDYLIIPDLIDQLIVTIWLMVLRLYIFFKGRVKSRKKKVLKIKHPLQVLTMTTFFLGIWNNSEQLWKKKIPFVPFVC